MSQNVFERVEKKFLLSEKQYQLLLQYLNSYMTMDSYGKHTICNIYYDTPTNDLISHSIEKPKYKEKLRLRSYGTPTKKDKVYIEIKKKYDGIVYKRRVQMTLEEAELYLNRHIKAAQDNQILKEIDYFMDFYRPIPKLYLAYERIAYFGNEDKNVRITFDHNIRSREDNLSLGNGDKGESLLKDKEYLMEVKVPGAMPLWLVNIMSMLEIYPVSFSKYGNIYKNNILQSRRDEPCSVAL